MNLYRITFRNKDGEISVRETEAANLQLVLESHQESDILKVERIDPKSGEVFGGFYIN
jgi:hypothetical protein